jgi:anti-sigma regulatory factor (Ser/Thr protein kinase)
LVRAEGAGPGRRYVRGVPSWAWPLEGLDESRVLAEVMARVPALGKLPDEARRVLEYVFTEIVNNAIEHSKGGRVVVSVEPRADGPHVTIADDGVGAFTEMQRQRGLPSPVEALQELVKGRVTTAPEHHTGEGLFFSSKAVPRFELRANGLRWLVDNVRGDAAIGEVAAVQGTHVEFDVPLRPARTLKELFDAFTTDFALDRTHIHVKLYEHGTEFVSRSEAKRLLAGLERFRDIVLDFTGVESIGQGFADEVFRVWPNAHRESRIVPVNANPTVDFFIRRALAEAGAR